jgi:hypothetical protein
LLADQRSKDAADGIAAAHQGDHHAADVLRRVFGHLRGHVRNGTSDAETGEEAHHAERDRIAGESGRGGEDAEEQDAGREANAAPVFVSNIAESDRPEHHPEQSGAHHEARLRGVNSHVLHNGRQRGTRDS